MKCKIIVGIAICSLLLSSCGSTSSESHATSTTTANETSTATTTTKETTTTPKETTTTIETTTTPEETTTIIETTTPEETTTTSESSIITALETTVEPTLVEYNDLVFSNDILDITLYGYDSHWDNTDDKEIQFLVENKSTMNLFFSIDNLIINGFDIINIEKASIAPQTKKVVSFHIEDYDLKTSRIDKISEIKLNFTLDDYRDYLEHTDYITLPITEF